MSKAYRKGGTPESSSQKGEASQSNAVQPVNQTNGLLSFFQGAGGWVADRYSDVTGAVGDFANRTGQAARDLWEVASI